jgi:hypothetical protein
LEEVVVYFKLLTWKTTEKIAARTDGIRSVFEPGRVPPKELKMAMKSRVTEVRALCNYLATVSGVIPGMCVEKMVTQGLTEAYVLFLV